MNIDKADSIVRGNYCYVYQYGRKINCDQEIIGTKYNDRYKLSLQNGGLAELKQSQDNKLIWKLVKEPKDSVFLLPQNATLSINHDDIKYLKINKTRAFLYKQLNSSSKTKSYLIKGDYVVKEEEKGDWLKVRYADKTVGWIEKNVVN